LFGDVVAGIVVDLLLVLGGHVQERSGLTLASLTMDV
jgi:hypothetical protein